MKYFKFLKLSLLVTTNLCYLSVLQAQPNYLNLYIDCDCDQDYLRQELSYVNHVRDQSLADVQLFINDVANGGGGRSYTLTYKSIADLSHIDHQLTYQTLPTMTKAEIRSGLAKKIAVGLFPYLMESDVASHVSLSVSEPDNQTVSPNPSNNPWNNWIFEVYGEADLDQETSRRELETEFGLEGDHVTENWRIRTDMEFNYSKNTFEDDEKAFISVRKQYYAEGSIVRSLGAHWSTGVFVGAEHSTYRNLEGRCFFRPAIEYNLFPYHDVLRREITFAYKIGYLYHDYIDPTIYGKYQEHLFNQSLDVEMRFRQPWGDISATLEASTYLHDFSRNRLELDGYASIRIFKGLAVRLSTGLELIRDQLSLPAGDASLEDVLLRQRQIATDFELSLGIGLSYTFGAAFNNIVNTRL